MINTFNLNWYFQAIEKMHYVAAKQIITSLFVLGGIILFVHSPDNIAAAVEITITVGLITSFLFMSVYHNNFHRFEIKFDFKEWKIIIYESLPLFSSSFLIAIYYNLDMVMLGFIKSQVEVGIYSAAYKIFMVGIIPFTIILNSFFPSLCRIGLKNNVDFKRLIKNYFLFLFTAGVISTIILFFFKDFLINSIFGENYKNATLPLSILAMNAIVIAVNIFFGNPLIAWGKQKEYSIAILFGAITNIIFNILLIPNYSYNGAAFATLLSEVAVFVGVIFLFSKHTKKIF